MTSGDLTGLTRHRIELVQQGLLFKRVETLLVLQVEVHDFTDTTPRRTSWRDAQVSDLAELERLKGKS